MAAETKPSWEAWDKCLVELREPVLDGLRRVIAHFERADFLGVQKVVVLAHERGDGVGSRADLVDIYVQVPVVTPPRLE
jgi:hypothetical protein